MMVMQRRKRKDENAELIGLLRLILERLDRIEKEVKRTCMNEGLVDVSTLSDEERANVKANIT